MKTTGMRLAFPAAPLIVIMLLVTLLLSCGAEEEPIEQVIPKEVQIGPADEEPIKVEAEPVVEGNDLKTIKGFWSEFTKRVAADDRVGVQDLFQFPMKDVDWLVEDVEGGVMEPAIFQAKYDNLFDSTALAQIPQIKVEELRKLDEGYEILGVKFKNGYEFSVNYNYDEMESSMIFFIDEFEDGFRICYLTVAG